MLASDAEQKGTSSRCCTGSVSLVGLRRAIGEGGAPELAGGTGALGRVHAGRGRVGGARAARRDPEAAPAACARAAPDVVVVARIRCAMVRCSMLRATSRVSVGRGSTLNLNVRLLCWRRWMTMTDGRGLVQHLSAASFPRSGFGRVNIKLQYDVRHPSPSLDHPFCAVITPIFTSSMPSALIFIADGTEEMEL